MRELMACGAIAPGDVDERSITDVRADDLAGYAQCHFFAGIGIWSYALRLAGWPDDREVWTGSCPCQPFSAAGKAAAFNDDRHLWPEFFRLIQARRPVVCFGEQVASIDGLTWLDLVQSDLDDAGYTCGAVDLCAAGFGAPHRRQRLYWVADNPGDRLEGTAGEIISRNGHRLASSSETERLGDSEGGERGLSIRECGPLADNVESERAGPVNGFWRSADWVLTRPQRVGDRPGLRPIERSAFPLAHGTPARVGRLRGYGDGIVAQAAQAFIEAYMNL